MDSLEDKLLERAKDSISTLVFSDFTQLPSTIGEVYCMERLCGTVSESDRRLTTRASRWEDGPYRAKRRAAFVRERGPCVDDRAS